VNEILAQHSEGAFVTWFRKKERTDLVAGFFKIPWQLLTGMVQVSTDLLLSRRSDPPVERHDALPGPLVGLKKPNILDPPGLL